jgi:PAS domain S-box-containing protein
MCKIKLIERYRELAVHNPLIPFAGLLIIMKIRYKMLLILGLITIALMGSLYVIAQSVMFSSIKATEEKTCSSNTIRFVRNLDTAIATITNNVNDWAKSDDAYFSVEPPPIPLPNINSSFIDQSPVDRYIESNLVNTTFINLNLNMILFFNSSGKLAFGKMYDTSNKTSITLDDATIEQVVANEHLFTNSSTKSEEGLILLNGSPMLVAASPILPSSQEGPSHGTLIMGRYLDESELASLSSSTGLPLSISLLTNSQSGSDFQSAEKHLSVENPIFTQSLNDTSMAGYVLLTNVEGSPIMVTRVDDTRVQYAQGMASMAYITVSFLAVGITNFIVITLLLDKLVVSRLSVLDDTVIKIRKTNSNSKRITVKGKDELSSLSVNINSMLDVIDEHTNSLEEIVKERTKDLSENQEKLSSILLASPDAIIAMDLEGNITECNDQVTGLYGFDRSCLIGKSALAFITEESGQYVFEKLMTTIEENKGIIRYESNLLKSDQTKFTAEISVNLIKNKQNEPFGFVAIVRDLSERKLLENRLFKSERLAAIGELAGMVGHDLRNPLTAIKNASYLLKKKSANCNDKNEAEMFRIIDKSIEYSNKIVNDLLDYSREITLEFTECSPKSLLCDTLTLIKVPSNINFLNYTTDAKFYVDAHKVVRVFVNLVKNAVEAMPDGGTLDIKSWEKTDTIVISFKDSGQGISPDTMSKMFTPLFTTKAQGMGLGLSICKRIVDAHGGKILVESTLNNGTTFTLVFPKNPRIERI